MLLYKVAEPNEALIISGLRAHAGPEGDAAGLGFKIVVGKGAFYVPGLQKVRHLSLDIHEAELDLECVTTQGIRVGVKAVVIYKIADDFGSIANAARRFLEQEEQMDVKVHNVFAGHLRSIVGTMTVEDLIRNRDKLTRATRESSASEMQRLGLTIDSLQIQEIEDNSGYIDNLSMPEAARVAKEARIAQAAADREATEREQEADALKVAAQAQSQIKQAEARAQAQRAQAEAEAIRARADALATNQEAVIGQQIAEQLPQIVAEAAKAFGNIGQLTVLNGAEGVGQMFSQVLGMGAAAIPLLRSVIEQPSGANGKAENGSTRATAEKTSKER